MDDPQDIAVLLREIRDLLVRIDEKDEAYREEARARRQAILILLITTALIAAFLYSAR